MTSICNKNTLKIFIKQQNHQVVFEIKIKNPNRLFRGKTSQREAITIKPYLNKSVLISFILIRFYSFSSPPEEPCGETDCWEFLIFKFLVIYCLLFVVFCSLA